MLKGCGCKLTGCKNRQCKCRAAGQACSASCRCAACQNTVAQPLTTPEQPTTRQQRQGRSIQPTILAEADALEEYVIPVHQEGVDNEGQLSDPGSEDDDEEEVDEWQDWDEHLLEGSGEALEESALFQSAGEENRDDFGIESDSGSGHDSDEGDD